jgi:hypothetical protein
MVNYLLLYSGGGMPANEAEQKRVMDAWGKWMGALGSSLVDGGNPFTPKAKTIDGKGKVSDGPAGMASGYSVVKANSMDEAVKMAEGCPVLMGGAKVMVFETFNVM